MRAPELSPRLRMVGELVPAGARLADVGTDHAYLPAALLLEGKIPWAVAADLRRGPLDRARATAREYGLTGNVAFRLCDGLSGICPGEVDAVAIAGMGGETIAAILSAALWVRERGVPLILQPMSSFPDLRGWLQANGFSIEEETRKAVAEFAGSLTRISAERIQAELVKLLVSEHPEVFRTLYETGITRVILPEFDDCMDTPQNHPHHCCSVGEHILLTLEAVEADKVLRLAALVHDIGKPKVHTCDELGVDHFYGHGEAGAELAGGILRRLKFDNDTIYRVKHLVKVHDYMQIGPGKKGVRRAVVRIGKDHFEDYLKLRRADILAQNPAMQQEKLEALKSIEKIYQEILKEQDCLSLKDLAVTGRDLIEAGLKPGPKLGEELNRLLELVKLGLKEELCDTKN